MPLRHEAIVTSFRFCIANRRRLQKVGQIACVDNKVIACAFCYWFWCYEN